MVSEPTWLDGPPPTMICCVPGMISTQSFEFASNSFAAIGLTLTATLTEEVEDAVICFFMKRETIRKLDIFALLATSSSWKSNSI